MHIYFFLFVSGLMTAAPAFADVSLNVADGASVSSPVHLEFTVNGMTVKPAAEGELNRHPM